MSLVPTMNLGIARPTAVISLNRVAELDYVRDGGDRLLIGAMTRHARVESDPLIAASVPLLAAAAAVIGDVQVRNRGTHRRLRRARRPGRGLPAGDARARRDVHGRVGHGRGARFRPASSSWT